MDESDGGAAPSGPRHARPAQPAAPSGPVRTRRWVLAGAGAALVGGGAGVAGALVRDQQPDRPRPNPPPAVLVAALVAEQRLIADLDATTGGSFTVRRWISAARADHAAHRRVLLGLLARYDPLPADSTVSSAPPRGTVRTRAQLRTAESAAASASAARAVTADVSTAALLASIAACEASHAELFS